MSDMLQLVVNIGDTQFATLRVYHFLSVAMLDDELKHVGHLVRVCSSLSVASLDDKLKHVGHFLNFTYDRRVRLITRR
jgi:hypothetical protein